MVLLHALNIPLSIPRQNIAHKHSNIAKKIAFYLLFEGVKNIEEILGSKEGQSFSKKIPSTI